MQLHHLSGPAGEEVLRESRIWEDIVEAIEEKRGVMGPNAMAIISVLAPAEDRTMIVIVDGYMTHIAHYLNVLVLDEILPEEFADAEYMMEKLRRHKALDAQKLLISKGGLPAGMKKPWHPEWN